MTIDEKHPLFAAAQPDWQLMADVYAGERAVKDRGEEYLPVTPGMLADGYRSGDADAVARYQAYRLRAQFPEYTREAISGLLGVIHRKKPTIEVPDALQPMVDRATVWGESLELLWQRVTVAQLLEGRYGLAVDVPAGVSGAGVVPYIATYSATTIPNWDTSVGGEGRERAVLIVLNESGPRRAGLRWDDEERYRILALAGVARQLGAAGIDDIGESEYVVGELLASGEGGSKEITGATWVAPSIASKRLERIPFSFVNPMDTTAAPDLPPLLWLARLCLAIYRADADHRQALFAQSQDTLVIRGRDPKKGGDVRVGAGAVIETPYNGGAEFIGPQSQGLAEQRSALENDHARASRYAVQLLDTGGDAAESGEALRVRVSARTATLAGMQRVAAAAIRDCLVNAGRWKGISEQMLDAIVVEPNLDFSDATVEAAALSALMDAKVKGAPISMRSVHAFMAKHEFTNLTYEEEQELIAEEETDQGGTGGTGGADIDPMGGNPPPQPPVPPLPDEDQEDAA